MSGIAGQYHPANPKPVDPARIGAMTDALAHRGSDGSGVWTTLGVGLGQPMALPDASAVISCDGEIYNYPELRRELERLGARFVTSSDTEIMLHGWRAWGPDLLARLNGVFAFALYDATDKSLFLARDRLGVKPLYLTELSDGAIVFASELKGLLAHPLVKRSPDLRAVEDFMALGYVPDDSCFVAGVRKLPAGHFLHLQRGRPVPPPVRWWDVDFSQRAKGSERDLAAELLERMRASVRSRMVADVPVGAMLSGGVDSAAVVAMMAEASPQAVRTSTIGFDEAGSDTRERAQAIAKRFATDHREATVRTDDVGLIDALADAFAEPFADPGALAAYRACELARQQVTVALAGDGADEAFAGHQRYRTHAAQERARALLPDPVQAAAGRLGQVAPRILPARGLLLALAADGGAAYAQAIAVTPRAVRDRLYSQSARAGLDGYRGEQRFATTMATAPAREPLDRAQYVDLKLALPGAVLTQLDRTSMAVGLATRVPLLDHQLIEFTATLPGSMRVRKGQGKWLMKQALEKYLPGDVLNRATDAFAPPISAWFRGPLADQAAALSSSRALLETGWFTPAAVATLAADHRAGRADHGRTLWQLLLLEKALARVFR